MKPRPSEIISGLYWSDADIAFWIVATLRCIYHPPPILILQSWLVPRNGEGIGSLEAKSC